MITFDLVYAFVGVAFLGWCLGSLQESRFWEPLWNEAMDANIRLLGRIMRVTPPSGSTN